MRADEVEMQRLGQGGEHPSSLEARAGMFLHQARPRLGLAETEIGAVERQLFGRAHARRRARLLPVLAALAVLLVAGTVMALASGWRPRVPFLGGLEETSNVSSPRPMQVRAKGSAAAALVPVEPAPAQAWANPTPRELRREPPSRRLARSANAGSAAAEVKEIATA